MQNVTVAHGALDGRWQQTKTIGPGKEAREAPLHVETEDVEPLPALPGGGEGPSMASVPDEGVGLPAGAGRAAVRVDSHKCILGNSAVEWGGGRGGGTWTVLAVCGCEEGCCGHGSSPVGHSGPPRLEQHASQWCCLQVGAGDTTGLRKGGQGNPAARFGLSLLQQSLA